MKRGNGTNSKEGGSNVWDVVASLAHALSDARDQLVGLINYDRELQNSQRGDSGGEAGGARPTMRCRGGGGGGYCKNHVPSNKNVRSVHREHARGHVAFGNHSEYKPEFFNSSCKPVATITCSPPRRRPGSAKGVSISFMPKSCSPPSCMDSSNCRSPSCAPYECRRHCIGNQYVAVLKEKACQIRERRLEKQCGRQQCENNAKPRWARC